jgi:hypothetical protein
MDKEPGLNVRDSRLGYPAKRSKAGFYFGSVKNLNSEKLNSAQPNSKARQTGP